MKCKQVQDFVLTDYFDGLMQEDQKNELQRHLGKCKACREFELSARKNLLQPFQHVSRFNPPDELWGNIKEHIQTHQQGAIAELQESFWEKLKTSFHFPRPAFVLASFAVMIFAGVLLTRAFMNIEKSPGSESFGHVQYLLSLSGPEAPSLNQANGGYGTEIEEFFL